MSAHERNKARLEQIKERLKLLEDLRLGILGRAAHTDLGRRQPLTDHQVEVARLLDQDLPWLVERAEWWIEENR